jgi:adenylate cyclase class IV
MTKKDAAEKVAKLMKLAKGSANEHESATARAKADSLAKEYGLTANDLLAGEMAAAFDELVDEFHKFVVNHSPMTDGMFGTTAVVTDVLSKIKNVKDTDKATRLRQIAGVIRIASFIAGDNQIVAEVKVVLDTALKNHGITI